MTREDREEMRIRFEEERLLHEGGFEPAPDDGAELGVRREEGDGVRPGKIIPPALPSSPSGPVASGRGSAT